MVGDPQCLPHRHLTVQDPGPQPREAVGELDDLADVVATRVQRPAQQRTELHHGEVGDQRCTRAGEREAGVQTPLDQSRRSSFVVHDVLAGPFGDLADGGDLLSVMTARSLRISASSSWDRDDRSRLDDLGRGGGEVEEGCGPEIHETYSIWNIRHNQTPGTRLWTGDSASSAVDERWSSLLDRNPSEHLKQRRSPGRARGTATQPTTAPSHVIRQQRTSPPRTASCGQRGSRDGRRATSSTSGGRGGCDLLVGRQGAQQALGLPARLGVLLGDVGVDGDPAAGAEQVAAVAGRHQRPDHHAEVGAAVGGDPAERAGVRAARGRPRPPRSPASSAASARRSSTRPGTARAARRPS